MEPVLSQGVEGGDERGHVERAADDERAQPRWS
jgi:hypothetical protein